MTCPRCGQYLAEKARYCDSCGTAVFKPGPGYQTPPGSFPSVTVPSYLAQAILVTIFCCMPFGVVSIVYAAQVNSKAAVGDIAGAQAASENAKTWAWASLGFGLLAVPLGILGALAG